MSDEIIQAYLVAADEHGLLAADEERELLERHAAGDEDALGRLVCSNLRLVLSIASRYNWSKASMEDMVNEGVTGLIHAINRFDLKTGGKLSTYATFWIKQRIRNLIGQDVIRLPSEVRDMMTKYRRSRSILAHDLGREPSREEVFDFMEADDPAREKMGAAMESSTFGESATDEDVPSLMESGKAAVYEHDFESAEVSAPANPSGLSLVDDFEGASSVVLTTREREVLRMRMGLGGPRMNLKEIGERFGFTRERARQVHDAAMSKLINYIEGVEVSLPF